MSKTTAEHESIEFNPLCTFTIPLSYVNFNIILSFSRSSNDSFRTGFPPKILPHFTFRPLDILIHLQVYKNIKCYERVNRFAKCNWAYMNNNLA
jgi:hypothetical protein